MTPGQIQELLDLLINMGETMASEAFRIAMKQTMAEAAANIIWSVIFAILAIAFYKVSRYCIAKHEGMKHYSDWDMGATISAIGSVISVLGAASMLSDAVVRLINPEWYAIEMIMGLLK